MTEKQIDSQQKHAFFFALALELRRKMYPLFVEGGSAEQEWKNVRQHSLVTVARVDELAQLLGLPKDLRQDLKIAAAVHDFDKPVEVQAVRSQGATMATFQELSRRQHGKNQAHLPERVRTIMDGAGVMSFTEMDALLKKDFEKWTPEELAQAILHYVDDYTIEAEWVSPINEEGQNQLDLRSIRQEQKPNNKLLDQDVADKQLFPNDETLHQAQRRIGHELEKLFVAAIHRHQEQIFIDALKLPEFIDQKIVDRIQKGANKKES